MKITTVVPGGGFVYLIESQGVYKIGQTKNLIGRLRKLQTASPGRLACIECIRSPVYLRIEKELHERFRSKRVRGEWFALTPEDIDLFKSLDMWGRTPAEVARRRRRPRRLSGLEQQKIDAL